MASVFSLPSLIHLRILLMLPSGDFILSSDHSSYFKPILLNHSYTPFLPALSLPRYF